VRACEKGRVRERERERERARERERERARESEGRRGSIPTHIHTYEKN